jgi:hypothetical protein
VLVGLLLLGSTGPAAAQSLFFEGGPPILRIDRFAAGQQTATATDASTTLVYERATDADRERKVTVSTVAGPGRFDLSVEALSPTDGTEQAPVSLQGDMAPTDLLRDISPCEKPPAGQACEEQATLRYRLRAAVTEQPGRVEYTVRYTLLVQ